MSVMTISGKVVRKRIENSEHEVEQWKVDHEEVESCHRLENWLATTVWIFGLIVDFDETWQTDVFRGIAKFDQEDYNVIGNLYQDWLGLEKSSASIITQYETQYRVEGTSKFRDCCKQARGILASRVPPEISKAIGLREMTLDAEESREIMEIIRQGSKHTNEPIQPMETVDASFLLGN